jgi:hypothetical protein
MQRQRQRLGLDRLLHDAVRQRNSPGQAAT